MTSLPLSHCRPDLSRILPIFISQLVSLKHLLDCPDNIYPLTPLPTGKLPGTTTAAHLEQVGFFLDTFYCPGNLTCNLLTTSLNKLSVTAVVTCCEN